jgi:hypothetical protein
MTARLRAGRALALLLAAVAVSTTLAGGPASSSSSPTAPVLGLGAPPTRVGWWVGGVAPSCPQGGCPHVYGDDFWQALRDTHAFLSVGVTYTTDFGPGATATDALQLIRRANSEGVPVYGWILATAADGTFANENNAALMSDAVKSFVAWRDSEGLKIPEAILDLELPAGYQPVIESQDPTTLLDLHAPIDPAHQCQAVRGYRELIAWTGGHGVVLSGSPVPFALDDVENGDMALADALDLAPLISGYRYLYLQAYRTYSVAGPDYVAGYFREMRRTFGRAGEVTLGDTTMSAPYDTVGPLVQDVRLLAGLGASRVAVFNLEGSLSKYGVAGVRQVGAAASHPMNAVEIAAAGAPNPNTVATRTFFGALDQAATTMSPQANPFPPTCP